MNTFIKSLAHGVGALLIVSVAGVVNLIPENVATLTISGLATMIVVAIGSWLEQI